MSGLRAVSPRGFGLAQRDRDGDHYQDLEARPEARPDLWVVPEGAWGPGRVELVEIPSDSEHNDNVVAYWVPDALPEAGTPLAFDYRLHWSGGAVGHGPPAGRVVATRRDGGTHEDATRWVIDFVGDALGTLAEDAVVRAVVSVGPDAEAARILEQQVRRNPLTGGWRLVFQVRPQGGGPLTLRAFLQHEGNALTETWSVEMQP